MKWFIPRLTMKSENTHLQLQLKSHTVHLSSRGGFSLLANYIGALGNPQNAKPEKIAMTAPVITKSLGNESEKIPMTAPVVTKGDKNNMVTMQFLLPTTYKTAEEAPKPLDKRVVIKEEKERKYRVEKFGGVARRWRI